jgi:DinB family protein
MAIPGRPQRGEAAPYYSRYIDRIPSEDVLGVLEAQLGETTALLGGISEARSAYRYAPDKWSIREVVSHVSDTERVFLSRAFWFARGFDSALPDFDQTICSQAARADEVSWARHVEEFGAVRAGTLAFFKNLPAEAWARTGVASGNSFTVRALAYIAAGHVDHHLAVLRERYS